jgi:hypothetical protein
VAGGLAAATGLDPTLVRLGVALFLLTGWGILCYLVAWVVIPEEDPGKGRSLVPAPEGTAKNIRIGLSIAAGLGVLQVIGSVLGVISAAIFGIGLLPFHILGLGDDPGFEAGEAMLGLLLLIGGGLLLFRRHRPWMPGSSDSGTGSGSGSGTDSGPGGGPWASPPPAGGPGGFGARATAAAQAARTNGPLLLVRAVGWLVGLWFLAAAVLGGAFWLTGALRVRVPVLPIVAVLAAAGFLGYTLLRSRRIAVIIAAMALLLVPTALAAGVTRVDGQAGDRSVVPRAASDLDRRYRHAIGVLEIDLSNLQLPAGETPLQVDMGAGQIEITVPWDAEVQARATVGAGSFDLFGNRQSGLNLDGRSRSEGQPGAPVLVITGKAGAGEIIVRRGYEPYTHQALRSGRPVPLTCYPSGAADPSASVATTMHCSAADGVTEIPALACVVADSGGALCRPSGEPEPAVDFAGDPGTRRCQVPAGGGMSSCTAPIPGSRSAGQGSGGQGSFTCTIPAGGGPSVCRPTGRQYGVPGIPGDPDDDDPDGRAPAPEPPISPAPPADPNTTPAPTTTTSGPPASAPPGEYRCTVPADGGPTTCEPI